MWYNIRNQEINVREQPRGQSNMDNAEKLATQGTQDEVKTPKNPNTICVGHHYAHTNTKTKNYIFQTFFLSP